MKSANFWLEMPLAGWCKRPCRPPPTLGPPRTPPPPSCPTPSAPPPPHCRRRQGRPSPAAGKRPVRTGNPQGTRPAAVPARGEVLLLAARGTAPLYRTAAQGLGVRAAGPLYLVPSNPDVLTPGRARGRPCGHSRPARSPPGPRHLDPGQANPGRISAHLAGQVAATQPPTTTRPMGPSRPSSSGRPR